MTTGVDGFLSLLQGVKCSRNGEWQALCPAHADRNPSLSVKASDGKVLVHCHAGCQTEDVVAALGLSMADLSLGNRKLTNGAKSPERRQIVATYDYGDYEVVRFEPKGFAQRRRNPDGTYTWGLGNVQPHLYRRQELLAADPADPIYVVEGEKAAERLRQEDVAATCSPMGAGKWRDTYSKDLGGRSVVILPDNDTAGRQHAERVARSLSKVAAAIRVVELPDLPKRGDIYDWLEAGHDLTDLEAVVAETQLWEPSTDPHSADSMPKEWHFTDLGNAKRLIAKHGHKVRYCYPWATWFVWNDVRWQADKGDEVELLAKDTVLGMYTEAAQLAQHVSEDSKRKANALWDWARKSESAGRIGAMISLAQSEQGIPVQPEDMDSNPWLLNCLNGVIELQTGKVRPHNKADFITKLAPVDYDPQAQHPLWTQFLEEALPDVKTREYVQRCAGYSCTGSSSEDVLLLCHGEGGTGKSTFREALMATLGDYSASAQAETFTTKRNPHAASPDLARLAGIRLVAVSEVETGSEVKILKRVTGGDQVEARGMYQNTFQFRSQFTLWLMANNRPNLPYGDSGIWRRMKEIPFVTKFNPPDTSIRVRLSTPDYAGKAILAWCVEGCAAWRRDGLGNLPQAVKAATAAWQEEMDPLAEFLMERTVEGATFFIAFKDLFGAYCGWARDNNVHPPLGRKNFSIAVDGRYQRAPGHNDSRGFVGLGLSDGAQIRADTSEMSASYDDSKSPQENPFTRGVSETNCPQVSSQSYFVADDEVSAKANENVRELSELSAKRQPQLGDTWDEPEERS